MTLSSVDVLGNCQQRVNHDRDLAHTRDDRDAAGAHRRELDQQALPRRQARDGDLSAEAPLGTSFHLTLSALAKLQITIARSMPGLRKGQICRAPSAKLARADAKRCTHTIPVEVLTRANEAKGADSISFSGRIGHHALSPGDYPATLSASNAAGRSKPVALKS